MEKEVFMRLQNKGVKNLRKPRKVNLEASISLNFIDMTMKFGELKGNFLNLSTTLYQKLGYNGYGTY